MLNTGRRFVCALAAVAAVVPFAAPAPSLAQSAQTTLKVALHSDLKIIDPIWTTALITTHHGNMVYDTLFALDEKLAKSVRNITGVAFVASARVNARDIMNATKVVATRGALEKLQEVLT